ncbi:MAG: type II toxin-antitoxin system RelE/ParE family toxin [Desulfovermiculus sp.]|nr:type II toxin-antitoxin system RelE/ParE family toxin [Desulfovermiculus sp.]
MTKYGVEYHPDVKSRDLPEINPEMKARIKKAIEERLQEAPYDYGLPLRKSLKRYWKIRVGDYRVVYKIQDTTVRIFCICHRKHAYKVAEGRG